MQPQIDGNLIASAYPSIPRKAMMPMPNGRPDPQLAQALEKVSPQVVQKARATSQDFEAMFLNSMFSQMTTGLKGEGPFGDTPGTGVWRSMLTEQYSKSFAKAGGVGVSDAVFRTLIMQQANQTQANQPAPKETP
ncbi:flagellar assembly peptidoglycan hydrolase FlgJ [Nitrobacter sp. NHB1]|uniref:flagellar assembly peptidoglycan hydrolase FlgJ n=1 Tax=Nitrobacter sp. NHB1 TaxID=3119830 RepID=UPI002FFF9C7A